MDDFSKAEWQAEQLALERAREKEKRAQARKAKTALRKLRRIKSELDLAGDTTDWEAEFSESVTERLEEFGSAFADPAKGGYGEALSYAQKSVIAQMKRKAKQIKEEKRACDAGEDPNNSTFKPRSSFQSKGSGFKRKGKAFTPRVRDINDDMDDEAPRDQMPPPRTTPKDVYLPEYDPREKTPPPKIPKPIKNLASSKPPARPPVGRPFLRIVKNKDDT